MADRLNAEWIQALSLTPAPDESALADLLAAMRRATLFYVRRRLAGVAGVGDDEVEALAEDMAQEAALTVLEKLDTFRGEAKFLTWACSFAIMLARTALRRRLWRRLLRLR